MDEESLKRRSNDIRYEEEQKFSAFSTSLCQPGCYLLDSRHNSYTLALLSGSKLELITLRKILIDSVRKIFPYDGQNCDVIIASGNLCHNLNRLNESMKSVAEALKLHFIKGTNSDIFYEEVVSYIGKEADPSPKLPLSGTTLISLIKKQDKKGLERELLQLKENLRQCGRESYLYMTFSISRLYTDLASELGSSGIELQDVFDNPMEEFKKVASSTTLEESIENLKQNLFKIVDSLNARKSKYGKQVEQAIDHIKHHYSESTLSIEDVARTVCLSTSYFSTIFKNETGITFTDYLIKIRMERAKNLLENTHMKMYEISSMTGYENAAYFSAAFKRYFGKSPSDVQNHR
jgi:two-component system response regulator YesN